MSARIPTVEELLKQADTLFRRQFDELPDLAACAPGRVNLIGEHTDYNDGFVMPIAIPLVTVIAGSFDPSGKCTIVTNMKDNDEASRVTFDAKSNIPGKPMWANYVKGVVKNFPGGVPGFCAVVVSSVPVGGGLSSSAALEVATFTFLEALTGDFTAKLLEKSLLCQKAEHEFAGVPCGIMDQYASIFGAHGNALLLDCRSMEHQLIPLADPNLTVLVINSNIHHELTSGEYPIRRKQCNQAAEFLGKNSLRDVTLEELMDAESEMPPVLFKRAKHVVTEIARTQEAGEALKQNDYVRFGQLMLQSHESLRDDYEVSCEEVDHLIRLTMDYGEQHDDCVYGSRITGGGFGGCTVSLVLKEEVTPLMAYVKGRCQYEPPTFAVVKPAYGARILRTTFATIDD